MEYNGKRGIVETLIDQLGFSWYQVRCIIILGIAQSADTMETLIQAILGPSLRCSWHLNSDLIVLLLTMVFFGSCAGFIPMGYLSDQFGRRSVALFSCILLTYITWLCSFAPIFTWMLILRFLSGILISGLLSSSTSLISEILPEIFQSTGQLLVCSFDSIVSIYIVGMGLGCLTTNLNWRYFLAFSTLPLIFCALGLSFLIYESPVLLAHKGKLYEAASALDYIASINKRTPKSFGGITLKANETFSFVGRLHATEKEDCIDNSFHGLKNLGKIIFVKYPVVISLLICIKFIWGFTIYGGTTLLPVELPAATRTCLQVSTLN